MLIEKGKCGSLEIEKFRDIIQQEEFYGKDV